MDARVDVAVVGGGVAGLWTLNLLLRRGYSAALVESDALGAGQSLASQGMIHGGQKYADGAVRSAVAAMPPVWEACLEGRGEIDLRGTVTLSAKQYMWMKGALVGGLLARRVAARVAAATRILERREEWPPLLARSGPVGAVLQLEERVLDVKSLLEALRRPCAGRLHRAEVVRWEGGALGLAAEGKSLTLSASRVVFCGGAGNERAAAWLGLGPVAQRRPLKQVLVRGVPAAIWGHRIGLSSGWTGRPVVTVTAHPMGDGRHVWYLGGGVAEEGVDLSDDGAILRASRELRKLFPDVEWGRLEWATFSIDRAEPSAGHRLPDEPAVVAQGDAALAWPTKMTLAPALASRALEWVERSGLKPGGAGAPLPLPAPEIGPYPWERRLEWRTVS